MLRSIGIIGASLAGLNAATALRQEGFAGRLVVVGDEADLPYNRPPLSKEILRGVMEPRAADLVSDPAELGIEWKLGRRATALDVEAKTVQLDDGTREEFAGIVIATGASARRWSATGSAGVHILRSRADALALREDLARSAGRVAVIGGGFLGQEVAATCRDLKLPVTLISDTAPAACVLGPRVAAILAHLHAKNGVDLRLGVMAVGLVRENGMWEVRLSDGSVVSAEVVVAAIGVIPNVQWLDGSGLKIKLGVICDESGLAAPGIVAAGDVAAWYDPHFGEPCHIEHWDNAVRQAVRAAQRLLQKTPSYPESTLHTVPWFWSDQYGRKIQVTGSTRQFDEVAVFRATDGAEKVIALFRRGQKLVAAFGLNVGRHILEYRRLLLSDPEWDLVKTDTRLRAYRESSA